MLTAAGPNRIAPRPVPVICEQLPVTDGIFNEEITKINAPAMARTVMIFLLPVRVFLIEKKPQTRNGIHTAPHTRQ